MSAEYSNDPVDPLRDLTLLADEAWLEHPDDVELAAYLDGALEAPAKEEMEAHLAACGECRALAADVVSAAALDPGVAEGDFPDRGQELAEASTSARGGLENEPRREALASRPPGSEEPGSRVATPDFVRPPSLPPGLPPGLPEAHTGRRFLAAAAILVLALGLWQWSSWDSRLGQLGLSPWQTVTEPSMVAQAKQALAGRWPEVSGFEAFRDEEGRSLLRGAEVPQAPEPLAPRWSAVRETRPELRVAAVDGPLSVLVVNSEEAVAASFEVSLSPSGPSISPSISLLWPEDQPALPPGLYAWSVSSPGGASAWVPFKVLDAATLSEVDMQIEGRSGLASALLLAEIGLVDEAASQLREPGPLAGGSEALRRELLAGLLATRELPVDLQREELERLEIERLELERPAKE